MSEHPSTLTRHRELTEPATDGSRTVTLDPTQTESESESEDDHIGILRLRGDPSARSPRQIQWAENVVDNEHLGRKKSKSMTFTISCKSIECPTIACNSPITCSMLHLP